MAWFDQLTQKIWRAVEQLPLDFDGRTWAIVVAVMLVIGLVCLRGSSLRGG